MGYISPKTSPTFYNIPSTPSYDSPKAASPKVTAYRNGVEYNYSIGQQTNTSSCRELIIRYLELMEKITQAENTLTNLNREKEQLERQIINNPERNKILSILGQIDPKKKGRSL